MYRVSQAANWRHARKNIQNALKIGIDLNNSITPSAVITNIYADGFDINLGGLRDIKLKWSVVESCWRELCQAGVYDKSKCCSSFGQAFVDPDCLDFVISRLFKKSGLLRAESNNQIDLSL